MKKTIIATLVGVIGVIAFCMICSEPAEDTSMKTWLLWEAAWIGVLLTDAKIFDTLDKKGLIK